MCPSPSADCLADTELCATQMRFLGALRAGCDLTVGPRPGMFQEPSGDTAAARWRIYQEGYVIRLAEAIGNDYPAVERIVGPAAFTGVCSRYLAAFPPSSHDIGRAGAALAVYLPRDPVTERLPFLPDLARFEWTLAEAFVARDVVPLTWNDVAALGAERLADLPLRAAPGTALIRSDWPLGELRLAKDTADGEIDIALEGPAVTLLVWRLGYEPRWVVVSEDEAAMVEGALSGSTPTTLLESGAFGAGQDAPLRLIAALRRIVELGILAPLKTEESHEVQDSSRCGPGECDHHPRARSRRRAEAEG